MALSSMAARQFRLYGVQQFLAKSSLDAQALAAGRLVVREPSLIRIDGLHATARHYAVVYDADSARIRGLRYALWRLELDGQQRWIKTGGEEISVGDERGPRFLDRGLETDMAACRCVGEQGDPELRGLMDADAIRALLAAYGLAADAGDADLVGRIYTADTVVEIVGDHVYEGRRSMEDMIRGEFHRSLLPWAGHTMGPGLVVVDGDRAESVHIGRTYGPPPGRIAQLDSWDRRPFRFSLNRWELERGGDGAWRVARRVSHPAPGEHWRQLLADGLHRWRRWLQRRAAPRHPELRRLVDAQDVLSTVTAAAFGLTIGDDFPAWPLTADTFVTIDAQVMAPTGRVVAAQLAGSWPCLGLLPTPGVVRLDWPFASVVNAVVAYVDDGGKRAGPARVAVCRWGLFRAAVGWVVTDLMVCEAGSDAATELLANVAEDSDRA